MDYEYSIAAVAVVLLATVVIGGFGLRISRTTSDFFVASRTVSPWWNASAIGGEYLSAASFLGVAGLVFAFGVDMLWFAVGYTVGYLVLLTLVAAPLRRSGAYTVPDFAEARLGSVSVRRIASVLTVGIGWMYLLPQLQAAGLTLYTVSGLPAWVGATLVVVVVIVNVMAGGMRAITFVQAFQFWLKLAAIAVPAVFLVLAWRTAGAPLPTSATPPVFNERTVVDVKTGVDIVATENRLITVDGVVDGRRLTGTALDLTPGHHQVDAGSRLTFPAGALVPQMTSLPAKTGADWARPSSSGAAMGTHWLYVVYSLIVATFLGVMGLPHVIVRFYTNPDGRAARRTTVVVLALLGAFYILPPVYGVLGRLYTPELLLTGQTDAVVLMLPGRLVGGVAGKLLGALLTGGAFAAFLSTSTGLTMSVAGVISRNVLRLRGVLGFRVATVVAALVPLAMALLALNLSAADVVGLAFAVAASSLCPVVVLGIWWPRLTSVGAGAGMIVGGALALAAGVVSLLEMFPAGWWRDLLNYPAAWTVPIGFLVTIVVSLLTPSRVTPSISRIMVRLHAPESLGIDNADEPA